MLGLILSLSLIVFAPPVEPPPTGAFDEAVARAHYEAFAFRYFNAEWGAEKANARFYKTAKKTLPPIEMTRWPVDAAHGVYANSAGKLRKFAWRAAGSEVWMKDRPETENKDVALGALIDLSYHYFDSFNEDIAPVYCAPAGEVSFAFQDAAACYFVIKAEYQEPGFWVALRELNGRVVIAGVLEHKTALEEPEKDRSLKPFLAAIEKQVAPRQAPKQLPGKAP